MERSEDVVLSEVLTRLSMALLTERSLKADLERVARTTCHLIEACSGASVSMMVDGEPTTVAMSDRIALELDMIQWDAGEGPCVTALRGEAVRIGFLPGDERFPHFAVGAADTRVRSVLSTPAIDQDTVVGSLNLYSFREEAFDDEHRRIAFVMAAEIANALAKSSFLGTARELRARLQEHHDTAMLVARATGLLIALQQCSAAQASQLIHQAASDNDEPVVATAQRILSSAEPGGEIDRPFWSDE